MPERRSGTDRRATPRGPDRRVGRPTPPPVPDDGLRAYPWAHVPLNVLSQWWGTHRLMIVAWIAAGYLHADKVGREWRIPRTTAVQFEAWLYRLGPYHPIYRIRRPSSPNSGPAKRPSHDPAPYTVQ